MATATLEKGTTRTSHDYPARVRDLYRVNRINGGVSTTANQLDALDWMLTDRSIARQRGNNPSAVTVESCVEVVRPDGTAYTTEWMVLDPVPDSLCGLG